MLKSPLYRTVSVVHVTQSVLWNLHRGGVCTDCFVAFKARSPAVLLTTDL